MGIYPKDEIDFSSGESLYVEIDGIQPPKGRKKANKNGKELIFTVCKNDYKVIKNIDDSSLPNWLSVNVDEINNVINFSGTP